MSKRQITKQVLSWQLPTAWVAPVVAALHASTARDLDGLEVFAGAKHLTAGCRSHGLLFETIEVQDGADQDVLTPAGLAKSISFLCRVKTRGLLWLGIPCSSWVFVGRSNAQRYFFHPEGNTNNEYTSRHNQIAEVGMNLAWLAHCLGVFFVIEQPSSSALFSWWPMLRTLFRCGCTRVSISLGSFGAPSQKSLVLHGTTPWLKDVQDASKSFRPQNPGKRQPLVQKKTIKLGIRISGKAHTLKKSGEYPPRFGDLIGQLQSKIHTQKKVRTRLFSIRDGL